MDPHESNAYELAQLTRIGIGPQNTPHSPQQFKRTRIENPGHVDDCESCLRAQPPHRSLLWTYRKAARSRRLCGRSIAWSPQTRDASNRTAPPDRQLPAASFTAWRSHREVTWARRTLSSLTDACGRITTRRTEKQTLHNRMHQSVCSTICSIKVGMERPPLFYTIASIEDGVDWEYLP